MTDLFDGFDLFDFNHDSEVSWMKFFVGKSLMEGDYDLDGVPDDELSEDNDRFSLDDDELDDAFDDGLDDGLDDEFDDELDDEFDDELDVGGAEPADRQPRGAAAGELILFPDMAALAAEVETLREQISLRVAERDDLIHVECRNLETTYLMALGDLEYRAYEAQCAYLRLKAKLDMVQARRNRQESVSLTEIEAALDTQFARYRALLDEKVQQMNDALIRSRGEYLSAEETRELKQLYRRVVKALHPDLHPTLTPAQRELFSRAVTAYENGDLDALRTIDVMVSDPVLPEGESCAAQLVKERERLTGLLERLAAEIRKIRSEFPYTVRELVNDPDKVEARRKELTDVREQYIQAVQRLTERIDALLR